MSDDIKAEWAAAFSKAQARFVNPPKSKTVSTGRYSYSYAELPDIIDSVRQVLAEYGLSFGQALVEHNEKVGCITRIYHSAGHCESFGPLYMPAGTTAQEYGSAATYARRYSLCAALGIAAEDDDDGAAASKKSGPPPPPRVESPSLSSGGPDTNVGGSPTVTGKGGKAPSGTYPKSASACGQDGHPAFADGEASCPDCGAPPTKVLNDRGRLA